MPNGWTPEQVTWGLLQAGALFLCFLILMIGVWALFQLLAKIDQLHNSIFKLSCLVVDRNARPPEITPPEIRGFNADDTTSFPPVR